MTFMLFSLKNYLCANVEGGRGVKGNVYTASVAKPERRRPLGIPRRRWEDNIKMSRRYIGRECGLDSSSSG
jgi:hypothetical protein